MDVAVDIKQRSNQLRPRLSHYHWKQVNLKDILSFQWLFFVREFDKFKRLQVFKILKFNFQAFFMQTLEQLKILTRKSDQEMTSVNLDQNFGYLINRFQDPEAAKKYTCSICTNVLKDPVQIDTAEPKLACYNCYTDNLR